MPREKISTDEENELLEILEEDKEEDEDDDGSENCSAECAEENPEDQKKLCDCIRIAEHSSRFSLRVMEAMRSLQNEEYDFLPTSSVEDIVDYIQENYRDDGDLYAQVRTALKQVCSQGFVMELLENEYHLIGPHAASMNQTTCSKGPKDCSLSSPAKTPKRRKQYSSEDMCMCMPPSNEKTGRVMNKRRRAITDGTAKQLERSRYSKLEAVRGNRKEDKLTAETESCTCSQTLTDEDIDTDMYEKGMQKNRDDREVRGHRAMETGDSREDVVTEIPEEIDEDDREADNIKSHPVRQNRIQTAKYKQRERELKSWIERCRQEYERRKNRRTNNN